MHGLRLDFKRASRLRCEDELAGDGQVKRYPKKREVIHDGSKPPKLGSYTPPKLYLSERIEGATLGRMGSVAGERERAAQRDPAQPDKLGGRR